MLFGALFVPQILVQLRPQSWQAVIGPYVPMEAGNLGAWAGFGVFSVYAVVALAVGSLVISRRDA